MLFGIGFCLQFFHIGILCYCIRFIIEIIRQYNNKRRIFMSHFISGLNISPQPLFDKNPLKDVVAPKYKHVLKDNDFKKSKNNDSWKQQIAISNLCKKLSERQFALLRKQNANQMQHQFSKLKHRIKKNLDSNSPSVSRFFEQSSEQWSLNIKSLLQKMPNKLHLAHKYNSKLVNYAQSIHDARRITKQKQNYARWLDHQNNSPVKSPNYCRMSFVLEKLGSCDNRHSGVLDGRNFGNVKVNINRNENSVIALLKDQGYKPKPSRVQTLGNDLSIVYR